jgi:hypothetical protein
MPISFTCPHCGTEIAVANEYAGQSGPCPACGRTIELPASVDPVPDPAGASPSKRGRKSPREKIRSKLPTGRPFRTFLSIAFFGLLILGAALVAIRMLRVLGLRDEVERVQCAANLRRIGRALLAYEAAEGSFPPAYLADESGHPKHSWRVLILPYLDERNLYAGYDFEEPWDGPNNLLLAEEIGRLYHCPSDSPVLNDHTTSYVMIVGPETISDGPTARSLTDLTDDPFDTILVAEAANSGIHCMEPRDVTAVEAVSRDYTPGVPSAGSFHPGVVQAVMCEGSVRSLPDDAEPEQIRAMATISGGETVWAY